MVFAAGALLLLMMMMIMMIMQLLLPWLPLLLLLMLLLLQLHAAADAAADASAVAAVGRATARTQTYPHQQQYMLDRRALFSFPLVILVVLTPLCFFFAPKPTTCTHDDTRGA